MAAPKGNEFWKLQSKHGRDKLFASPELMWEAACEYFQWCVDNPLISIEYYGKDAERCEIPKMRAFTFQGLCSFLNCNTKYFNEFAESCSKDTNINKAYSHVLMRIRDTVYQQKFEGAAAGFLNATVITRDLGLKDSQTIDANITEKTVKFDN